MSSQPQSAVHCSVLRFRRAVALDRGHTLRHTVSPSIFFWQHVCLLHYLWLLASLFLIAAFMWTIHPPKPSLIPSSYPSRPSSFSLFIHACINPSIHLFMHACICSSFLLSFHSSFLLFLISSIRSCMRLCAHSEISAFQRPLSRCSQENEEMQSQT